ncbi:MAG: tRNA (guanosine(37)-N1)-methyltransferase TrmD [Bifidobacteriaceae bacterium]|jgi:tRNA (guanine37-N1)-methyltransferase|nr:tRNA (guanosine(37)-N1)-methyltransferase TrmD [Bifidobacteriaceae bacterium]
MLIDVVTIFPEYLAPARLSLLGKAADAGIVRLRVHDLRDWTSDRHRTVDDTPYGGGAGMVMRPEPWGRALDDLLAPAGPEARPGTAALVIPTASGELFAQDTAARLAQADHLVFACGRYEGIDARVAAHYRDRVGLAVAELSIGDYVLAGGEAAALVIIEAITRLLPGVLGNAESLAEESHVKPGLLEYPVYTKPPSWRGLDVPEVLTSGHHGRIAEWRRAQAAERTRRMRPDLAGGGFAAPPGTVEG